jgi:AcrR family transcriptional regulator
MAPPARSRKQRRSNQRKLSSGRPTLEQAAQLDLDVRECALRLFLEHGYESTTMAAIARAAGTTKVSLYARFANKAAVFSSVLEWAIQRPDWPIPESDPPDLDDLEEALTAIARSALRRATDPSMVKLGRIAIAQALHFPEIAHRTHAESFWPRHQLVVELMARHAAAGEIVVEDPEILAEHFLGMVAGMPARLASFGIVRDAATQDHHTEIAVQLFMRGLRTCAEVPHPAGT